MVLPASDEKVIAFAVAPLPCVTPIRVVCCAIAAGLPHASENAPSLNSCSCAVNAPAPPNSVTPLHVTTARPRTAPLGGAVRKLTVPGTRSVHAIAIRAWPATNPATLPSQQPASPLFASHPKPFDDTL